MRFVFRCVKLTSLSSQARFWVNRAYEFSNVFAITARFRFIPLCYTSFLLLPVAVLRTKKALCLTLSNFTKPRYLF